MTDKLFEVLDSLFQFPEPRILFLHLLAPPLDRPRRHAAFVHHGDVLVIRADVDRLR
jgi:hypothetical protein